MIYKALAINEWSGKILAEIEKSCPHYGLQLVESVEHRFFGYPFDMGGSMMLISVGKILPKEGTLAQGNPWLWCNAFLINSMQDIAAD